MKEIIKFELLYKLFCAVIALPLFNTIFNLYAKYVIGQANIYNYEMFKVLLGFVSGLMALAFIIIVTLSLIYLEYSVIIKLIFELEKKSNVSWEEAFLSSFSELSIFRKPKNILSFLLFALLNPLWHLTFTSILITELTIPLFITNEILKNPGGIILVCKIYLILFLIYDLLSFVPIYMVLK